MVSESVKDGGTILPQFINEKEKICNKHEPSRVFGTSFKFLKKQKMVMGRDKNSCVCRVKGILSCYKLFFVLKYIYFRY